MLSIIIPSRNEQFLYKTVLDLLEKAQGEIEIICILDGYWIKSEEIINDKRVRIIHFGESKGMRAAINAGVAISSGEYIMKCDGHCLFDQGFDIKLVADCKDNWVCIPTRKRLDAENWCIQDIGKPDIDYMFLSYPENTQDWGGSGLHGKEWKEKNYDESLRVEKIVDLISFQGSCWFMEKSYFYFLELMDEENYGQFWQEAQEIGLKVWLSGGRVIRNKNTWYCHLHKSKKYGRGYFLDIKMLSKAVEYTNKWFTQKNWHKQTLPLSWLIEKFMPMPTWDEEKINKLKEIGN